MPVSIKSSSSASSGASHIVLPTGISSGDLILIFTGSYYASISLPAGWTTIITTSATGTYTDLSKIYYRISDGTESGLSIQTSDGNYNYSGIHAVVVTGHDPAAPIHATSFNRTNGSDSNVMSTNSISTTKTSRLFYFWSQMANDSPVPTWTVPTGITYIQGITGSGGYHRTGVYIDNDLETPPTTNHGAETMLSSMYGSFSGTAIAIGVGNVVPVATVTAPADASAQDPRNTITFSWNYSDAEGNAQTAYQIQYRERGTTGAWTTASGTTATSHTFASNTFTLGKEYEYQVRVSDASGYGNWTSLRWFMAGVDTWKYTGEVTSTTTSGSTAAITSTGTHIVEVRTADQGGLWGPWSTSTDFTVNSPPNKPIKVSLSPARVGGDINLSWIYSDAESNPQTKYQIQYRRKLP